jgi:hypothetical protein
MATSFIPVGKWSVVAVLALTVATFSVGGLAASDAPGPPFEQPPSGTLKSDSPGHVEAGAQSAAPESESRSAFGERFASLIEEPNSAPRPSFNERFASLIEEPNSAPRPSFNEWFATLIEEPNSAPRPSFNERFAAAFDRYEEEDEGPASPSAAPSAQELQPRAEPPRRRSVRPVSKNSAPVTVAPNDMDLMQEPGGRTAIYDILARAVYLPSGERLEAHSGLGNGLDDPRYVGEKGRGPTPPNVYRLVLREQLFHGVRAIRLVPVDERKMFGRAGMLAHSYMLGPDGRSNGCVSFQDYPAFLNAFLRGEVDRLAVVDHLEGEPTANAGLGWLPDFIRKFLTPS